MPEEVVTLHFPVLKDGSFLTIVRTAVRRGHCDKFSFFSFTISHVYLSLHVHRALFESL